MAWRESKALSYRTESAFPPHRSYSCETHAVPDVDSFNSQEQLFLSLQKEVDWSQTSLDSRLTSAESPWQSPCVAAGTPPQGSAPFRRLPEQQTGAINKKEHGP